MLRSNRDRFSLKKHKTLRGTRSGRTRQLGVEVLENRQLMAAYINEVHFSPLFGDPAKHQYVELRGDDILSFEAGTYLVVISSADGVVDLGDVHTIFDLSNQQLGSNGMLVLVQSGSNYTIDPAARVLRGADGFSGMPGNVFSADSGTNSKQIRSGSNTFLLIKSNVAPLLTNDIDSNDDGTPDGAYLNWTILDGFTVFHSTESIWPQKGYAPIVFQQKGVGTGMPSSTLVQTDALAYVSRIGKSTGYSENDWVAGNTTEDVSTLWSFQLEDGIHGIPRPRAYAGRHLDHIGGPNWVSGISGSVFLDLNSDGVQQVGERPIPGASVVADLAGDGQVDFYAETIEPDNYTAGRDLTNISFNATLTTAGTDNISFNFNVLASQRPGFSTGQHIFSHSGVTFFNDIRRLRTDFYRPARSISVNVISDSATSGFFGRLEIFNAANQSLGFARAQLGPNQTHRLTVESSNDDIAWAVAYSEGSNFGMFDNLSYVLGQQTAVSDAQGNYILQGMTRGNYSIQVVPPPTYDVVFPLTNSYTVGISNYESYPNRNFGLLGGLPPTVNDQTFRVSEANTAGSALATLQFSKGYPSQALKATITAGDPTGLFKVDPATGKIILNRSELDFETKQNYSLTVKLTDDVDAALNDSAVITLIIDDANDAPVVQASSKTLSENSSAGTFVATMTFTDQDPGAAGQATWSIVGGNTGNAFAINATTGEVRVNDASSIDYETSKTFNLIVRATDQGQPAMPGEGILTVSLIDVNEAPVLIGQALSINENSVPGTVVGTINVNDPDANETLQWQILGGTGAGLFQIGSDARITLSNGAALDYEQTKQYDLTIKVTDSGALTHTQTYTISIQDQNDKPTITSSTTLSVKEDAVEGTVLGVVTTADQDVGQKISFSLAGAAASKFVIDPASGEVRVAAGATFDFETAPTLAITIDATDDGTPNETVRADFTIRVTNANEAPSILSTEFDIAENSAAGTSLGSVSASDPDAGDTLSYAIVQQTVNWLSINETTGALTVASGASIDFETVNLNTVLVRVTDSAGLSTLRNLAIHALDQNDPPTVVNPLANATAKAGQEFTYTIQSGTFSDPDLGDSMRLFLTDGLGFPIPSWLTYTPATGVLRGTPTAAEVGAVELRLTAVDSSGASASSRFTITVEPAPFSWHNPTNRFDSNGSGNVSPIDALIIINYLNSGKPRDIAPGSAPSVGFLDVSPDNIISPRDALLVINELNRLANGEGEGQGEPSNDSIAGPTAVPYTDWLYLEQLEERKRQEELIEILAMSQSLAPNR